MSLSEEQRQHLDQVQAVVTRMGSNSFLIKGWTITLATAVYGYAATHRDWRVPIVGLVAGVLLWALDAYYLWQERLFRKLYESASQCKTPAYSMDTAPWKATRTWRGALVSRTIWPIYIVVSAVGIFLLIDQPRG